VANALARSDKLVAGPVHVLAAGKASAGMAHAFAAAYGSPIRAGLIIGLPRFANSPSSAFAVLDGAHPVPDERSVRAARAALALARSVPDGETLVVLLSGGASALMALPAEGLTLADKQAATRTLLRAGADIHAINCVRKHLSAIKGGRLAAACAGSVVSIARS
jgi:hydroxypyruvate reductase